MKSNWSRGRRERNTSTSSVLLNETTQTVRRADTVGFDAAESDTKPVQKAQDSTRKQAKIWKGLQRARDIKKPGNFGRGWSRNIRQMKRGLPLHPPRRMQGLPPRRVRRSSRLTRGESRRYRAPAIRPPREV